jgi:predicted nucleic acid-binding protein
VTIIADTSPLHYAVLIGVADALFVLYGALVIPAAVHSELMDAGAPLALREWVTSNLHRIEIRQVDIAGDPYLGELDGGEAEAILLAQLLPDSLLIIDERDGRAEARRRGLRITGLLGVIRDAALSGYLDFEEALQKLRATDFRLSSEIEVPLCNQWRASSR